MNVVRPPRGGSATRMPNQTPRRWPTPAPTTNTQTKKETMTNTNDSQPRCGRETRTTGAPCRTPVARAGIACGNHRNAPVRRGLRGAS